MCDEYKYVAIGGITKRTDVVLRALPWFVRQAHMRGAKIHGLGFTSLPALPKIHFDSVDSSTWTGGNRFGFLYVFKDGEMQKIMRPPGKKMRHVETAVHNFCEWVRFAKWAETHL